MTSTKDVRAARPSSYELLPRDLEGFDVLADLALDMHASWNHSADALWRQLDAELWEFTHNPWGVLQTISRDRLKAVLADPSYLKMLHEVARSKARAAERPSWFQQSHPQAQLSCVAYFSMEFMLSEALPIYSGGLGNVAGDQLKAASDLGVPVIGIGLLYQQGYFRQVIDQDGAQQALYPYNDPGQLPIAPLRHQDGRWLRLQIALPGYSVWLRAWQVKVGTVQLYLLDSNDVANLPAHRGITSELYGGGPELRLQQELLLGIGGFRLLRALGIQPEVCHLNEGHAAFAVLERAYDFMQDTAQKFEVALAATRAGNLFTTHTAVSAGFDRFEPQLIERYLGGYARERLGLSFAELAGLGRQNPDDASESFNMAYLAIRGSGRVNGVSLLHGQVSRSLFAPLFPRWPIEEIPVGSVTNGVHVPTWDSSIADALWTTACGKDRWLGTAQNLSEKIRRVSDQQLWQLRTESRAALVAYARERLALQLTAAGAPLEVVHEARQRFNVETLTLGFARRFATYKRPDLLLRDPERLRRLLTNTQRPVQLILAGKAHPADKQGQDLIQAWVRFIDSSDVRQHVIFLSDHDMLLTECLVQGVDLWLNTPRRPWEACGTSGMKVLVNGGLNLSELDGWWAEAYAPDVGWAIGDGGEHGNDPAWDAQEAEALYALLENDVIPSFYARDAQCIPTAWVARIRESMAQLTPRFSANRAVQEYTEQHYLPAAALYRERAADNGAQARDLVAWREQLNRAWEAVRIEPITVQSDSERHNFRVVIDLAGLDRGAVRVELFAAGVGVGVGVGATEPFRQDMSCKREDAGLSRYVYTTSTPSIRPASDFSVRMLPHRAGVAVPLEATHIRWEP